MKQSYFMARAFVNFSKSVKKETLLSFYIQTFQLQNNISRTIKYRVHNHFKASARI